MTGSHGFTGSTLDLQEVFRTHLDYVWRLARTFGLAPEDADDVAQEVFVIVARRLSSFRVGAPIRAWLFGITRNVVMHVQRKQGRRMRALSIVARTEPAEETPEHSARVRQAAALMQTFLDQLELDKRLVFVLVEIEGMTTPEIAEMLQLPQGTVSSRLRAARQRLELFTAGVDSDPSRAHG